MTTSDLRHQLDTSIPSFVFNYKTFPAQNGYVWADVGCLQTNPDNIEDRSVATYLKANANVLQEVDDAMLGIARALLHL